MGGLNFLTVNRGVVIAIAKNQNRPYPYRQDGLRIFFSFRSCFRFYETLDFLLY